MHSNLTINEKIDLTLNIIADDPLFCNECQQLERLRQRFTDHQLILSVFGQFKRGKSTFINALLNKEILSTGIIPVTAVITRIIYSNKPFAKILFENETTNQIAFDEIRKYTDESLNSGNHLQVRSVLIGYPSEVLKNGLMIVDTPGVGSLHLNNTEAAADFLEKTDAAIFMLSVDSPLNAIELDLLKQIEKSATKIYCVVNKTDLVSPADKDTYLHYCEKMIDKHTAIGKFKLYSISAVTKHDSGIEQLMKDIQFDFNTQGNDILMGSIERKWEQLTTHMLSKLDMAEKTMLLSEDELQLITDQLLAGISEINTLKCDVPALTDNLSGKIFKELENCHLTFQNEQIPILKSKLLEKAETIADYGPKAFAKALNDFLNEKLKMIADEQRAVSLAFSKERFEHQTKLYTEKLQDIYYVQYKKLAEILKITPNYCSFEPSVSEHSDYRFSGTKQSMTMFLKPEALLYLLPKKAAQRQLLKELLNESDISLKRVIANILSDDRYRLRESVRAFQSAFQKDADVLLNTLQTFLHAIKNRHEQTVLQQSDEKKALVDKREKIVELL